MSRTYYFCFTILNTVEADRPAIEAIERELNIPPTEFSNGDVEFADSVILCGGMSEAAFADSVRDTIWEQLGHFASITVGWNYIEEFDDRIHYDKAAYVQWTAERKRTCLSAKRRSTKRSPKS